MFWLFCVFARSQSLQELFDVMLRVNSPLLQQLLPIQSQCGEVKHGVFEGFGSSACQDGTKTLSMALVHFCATDKNKCINVEGLFQQN